MVNQEERRRTTGGEKKVRIEGWFTPLQRDWLRAYAQQHGLSVSQVLRFAVGTMVHQVVQAESARATGGQDE